MHIDPFSWDAYKEKLEAESKGTFWSLLNAKLEQLADDKVVISLDVEQKHLNAMGIVHGGVHAALLDSTMGLIAMVARPQDKIVTTNLNIHYLKAVQIGTLYVTAQLVHQSKRIITAEGEIKDGQGTLAAFGTGSFRVI